MVARAKKRATPSGFMMNGPMPSGGVFIDLEVRHVDAAPGDAVPGDQFAPGLYGLPLASQEARL